MDGASQALALPASLALPCPLHGFNLNPPANSPNVFPHHFTSHHLSLTLLPFFSSPSATFLSHPLALGRSMRCAELYIHSFQQPPSFGYSRLLPFLQHTYKQPVAPSPDDPRISLFLGQCTASSLSRIP
ncbi:hypothetical protein L207DRAFT_276693 [Hyaloscypha variabilis F]|uniref:Uncharacterized protein n=1 Tax=Hyaloscypha variabilis (strain UAMH 11265 / GT02V1 / F) TaxID=1149755 RepID=A0A2J6S0F9_HYAVF|nr:hypothetical protein L207DRAFT_276693 [Hyaloscypha variabilis F]